MQPRLPLAFVVCAAFAGPAWPVSQQSAAVLDAPLVVMPSTQRLEHLLDWDGDGVQDAVSLYQFLPGLLGWIGLRNDHHGVFSGWISFSRGGPSSSEFESRMLTCDANHDGRDDLLWVVPRQGSFAGFMNVFGRGAAGAFLRFQHLDFEGALDFGLVTDVDRDGDADRIRVLGQTLYLDLFTQGGGGAWSYGTTSIPLGFVPQTLIEMDHNGDAYPDLYLHHGLEGSFVCTLNGSLQSPVTFTHGISTPPPMHPMPVPGDVDGDGDQDLALFDMDGYALYRRTGPTSWQLEPRRTGGPAVKLADVDLDGDLDGICCGGSGSYPAVFGKPATFRVALNDGTGGFAPAFTLPGLGSREIAGASDLDGDGDVDLVAGQCIYFARGPLDHSPQLELAGGAQSLRSLGDFDGDGDPDFTSGIDAFERHLGDGTTRGFTPLQPAPPAGASDEGPGLPGDWDGDGDLDLLVRRTDATSSVSMRLLLNEGGGSYADGGMASAVDLLPAGTSGVRPENSLAADLDLDGDLDLLTFVRAAVHTQSRTLTWLNQGQGQFIFAWERAGAWPLGLGALCAEAWPDVLLVYATSGAFDPSTVAHLLRGRGDGGFDATSRMDLYLGDDVGPASVALEDFDGDGDLDLAGAFQFGSSAWYSGKGWFIPSVDGELSLADKVLLDDLDNEIAGSVALPTPRIAVAGDIDGDGLLDVILSSPLGRRSAISIVLRKADNSGWLPPVRHVIYAEEGDNVAAIPGACVDIDGDGNAEYVTDAIWRNVLRSLPDAGARQQNTRGRADEDGRIPTLGASGPFRPGSTAVLRLTGAPGGMPGVLYLGPDRRGDRFLPFPRSPVSSIAFQTSGATGQLGNGAWSLAFSVPGSLAASTLFLTAEVHDPLHPARRVRSNDLRLDFGR